MRTTLTTVAFLVGLAAAPLHAQGGSPKDTIPVTPKTTVERTGKEAERVGERTEKAADKAGKQTAKQAKKTSRWWKRIFSRKERREQAARDSVEKADGGKKPE